MGIDSLLFSDPTLKILHRDLNAQAKQLEAVTSNLANMETPGYKAIEVDFERVYQAEINATRPEAMTATNPRHFGAPPADDSDITIREQDNPSMKVDANNVDMDREMARMAMAQLRYSTATTAMAKKLKMISDALTGQF